MSEDYIRLKTSIQKVRIPSTNKNDIIIAGHDLYNKGKTEMSYIEIVKQMAENNQKDSSFYDLPMRKKNLHNIIDSLIRDEVFKIVPRKINSTILYSIIL